MPRLFDVGTYDKITETRKEKQRQKSLTIKLGMPVDAVTSQIESLKNKHIKLGFLNNCP